MNHAKREPVVDKVPAMLAETDAVVTLDAVAGPVQVAPAPGNRVNERYQVTTMTA